MATELEKFEMRRKKRPEDERGRLALEAGALATGGLAARHSITHSMIDMAETANVPKTNAYEDYLDKLQPGDLVFNREFGKADRGLKPHIYDALAAAKGDNWVHPTVYRGRNRISEAGGGNVPAKAKAVMDSSGYPMESRAYRIKDLGHAEKQKAFKFLDEAAGTPYKSLKDTILHGVSHLAGIQPPTSGNAKKACKDGIVCSELVAEAYPKRFTDKYISPIDMRHHPDLELIGRYGHVPEMQAKEKILARGVYPVLKNLKYGLLAGGAAYGGMTLADYFRKHAGKGGSDGGYG